MTIAYAHILIVQEFNAPGGSVQVVVAGGLVANMLRPRHHRWPGQQDVDIFIVAATAQAGTELMVRVVGYLAGRFVVHAHLLTNNALTIYGTPHAGNTRVQA